MLAAGGQVIGGSVFQTAMPAGPTGGYQNQLANNNAPVPQAPSNQVAQAQQQLGLGGGSDKGMAGFSSKLDELVRLQQQNNNINNKILQRQS